MDINNDLEQKYNKLKVEFETYQSFAESTIQILSEKNIKLEKGIDALTNIVEISKYINSNISDSNLIPMINDMIIGILGVTYSSIYIQEKGTFTVKATNIESKSYMCLYEEYFKQLKYGKTIMINCKTPIFEKSCKKKSVHSVIGTPINLRDKLNGYIIVEHTLCNFFSQEHLNFISSIGNQIAIALENNFLYTKVRESSIRDPLLGIYNRKYFFDEVANRMEELDSKNVAIIMIDLDDFKKVNDIYGHQFGDKVLIKVVEIIKDSVYEGDIVARYGGEEIVVYMENIESYEEAYNKTNNIRNNINNNIMKYKDSDVRITASFGISYYPYNGQNLDELLSFADKMLYRAKDEGKNKIK